MSAHQLCPRSWNEVVRILRIFCVRNGLFSKGQRLRFKRIEAGLYSVQNSDKSYTVNLRSQSWVRAEIEK